MTRDEAMAKLKAAGFKVKKRIHKGLGYYQYEINADRAIELLGSPTSMPLDANGTPYPTWEFDDATAYVSTFFKKLTINF